jgi:hypothetical protein
LLRIDIAAICASTARRPPVILDLAFVCRIALPAEIPIPSFLRIGVSVLDSRNSFSYRLLTV